MQYSTSFPYITMFDDEGGAQDAPAAPEGEAPATPAGETPAAPEGEAPAAG